MKYVTGQWQVRLNSISLVRNFLQPFSDLFKIMDRIVDFGLGAHARRLSLPPRFRFFDAQASRTRGMEIECRRIADPMFPASSTKGRDDVHR
jgi:hypothetical protein